MFEPDALSAVLYIGFAYSKLETITQFTYSVKPMPNVIVPV